MDSPTIVALLSQVAAQLREDLELMETGVITCTCFGAEVTEQHTGRMAVSLAKIEAIIDDHQDAGFRVNQPIPAQHHESHSLP